ncbi:peptide N-acetyl-beta-D-glucosaminyl asparaginase amidase A-domain-containing protein [Apiosordaria backusii]|uniref:Peptide N-acetyl-beta-D-glucosaminyl asparaginase amidase A-domain-containing protein n=1 Tax=Apiosordaria backusii TaxID=314023 RepID=A0AA40K4I5_9PEZI|nr:peptide N-acetyl-beta-D-glucosaminyl asparaginase amidase A-domain-containing protein [Apiosordaria backusii]
MADLESYYDEDQKDGPIQRPLTDAATTAPTNQRPRRRILLWLTALIVGLTLISAIDKAGCSGKHRPESSISVSAVSDHHSHDLWQSIRSRAAQNDDPPTTPTSTAPTPTRTVLKNFEVAQPVRMPDGPADSDGSTRHGIDYTPKLCTVLLMRRDFAWSYGDPFIGNYTPPDCPFNRVVLNFSSVSVGRQYDRLAVMYFGDTEVWRTSTAQPTVPPGISWIYLKDMTQYMYFWKRPQKVIFDLGNLINEKYTGIFNTTMTAIFYNDPNPLPANKAQQAPPSDLILPISAQLSSTNSPSVFTLPSQRAVRTFPAGSLPRDMRRAVVSLSTTGQANEEFFWSNVLESDTATFTGDGDEYLPGLSPFREVQLYIDSQLAGVSWPFPVIFTGGVVPSLHRPIAGIQAFDIKEQEIDISPWLPLLCDGGEHTLEIKIAGVGRDGKLTEKVGENWVVTGKVFIWLDYDRRDEHACMKDPGCNTTGLRQPLVTAAEPEIVLSSEAKLDGQAIRNETLNYSIVVKRRLEIKGQVSAFMGREKIQEVKWVQELAYSNQGVISQYGFHSINDLVIEGRDQAGFISNDLEKGGQRGGYEELYQYPLFVNSSYEVSQQGNLSIWAHAIQGRQVEVDGWGGGMVFPTGLEAFDTGYARSKLYTIKEGTAEFRQTGDGMSSTGWGESSQEFEFTGDGEELYWRSVGAVNGSVIYDRKRMGGDVIVGGPKKVSQVTLNQGDGVYVQVAGYDSGEAVARGPRVFL